MVQSNNKLIRSFQGQMDRRFQSLTDQVNRQNKGGGKGNKGGKANKQGSDQKDKHADSKQQSQGDAGKRKIAGRQVFNRRGKRSKKQ